MGPRLWLLCAGIGLAAIACALRPGSADAGQAAPPDAGAQADAGEEPDASAPDGAVDAGDGGQDNLPSIRFTPPSPAAGQTVRAEVTDRVPWAYVDLGGTGPCGGVFGRWAGVDASDAGTWTWHFDLLGLTGGSYSLAFTADNKARSVVQAKLEVAGPTVCGPSRFIYGIHSWNPGASALMSGKKGWAVEIMLVEDPNRAGPAHLSRYDAIIAEGFEPITWLEWSWTTVPYWTSGCPTFAGGSADAAVKLGARSKVFVLGNETNLKYGRTREVTVAEYVSCYQAARSAIRSVRPEAQVLVQAVGPWNPETDCASGPYDHTAERWKNYLHCIVQSLGAGADGYAVHAYGGRNGDRDPSDDGEWGFGVFEATLAVIDGAYAGAAALPVHLTEWNIHADGTWPAYDATWSGFIGKAFDRLGSWNAAHAYRIKSASYFTYDLQGWEKTNLTASATALADFKSATSSSSYPSQ
ncbi:MAG: hypothetical protein HYZ28_02095 [Myxococcales bacterium]|nr:hypothetical protein [Myxococcales bacterium]